MSSTADVEAAKKGSSAAKGGMGTPIKILLVVGLLAVAGGGAAVRTRRAAIKLRSHRVSHAMHCLSRACRRPPSF